MTEDLYLFSRKLAGVVTLDDLLWATAYQIAQMLKVRVVLLLPEGETIEVRAGYPPEDMLDDADLAAAKWAWQHDQARRARRRHVARRQAAVPADADGPRHGRRHRPRQRYVRSDACRPTSGGCWMPCPIRRRLPSSASIWSADVDRTRLAAETERLRNALLTSISHDLRTPLASILGSATSLRDLSKIARREVAGRTDRP